VVLELPALSDDRTPEHGVGVLKSKAGVGLTGELAPRLWMGAWEGLTLLSRGHSLR
jgi:hypothetical protein